MLPFSLFDLQNCSWTVFGPFSLPGTVDPFSPVGLESLSSIPATGTLVCGQWAEPHQLQTIRGILDFEQHLDAPDGVLQVQALFAFEAPCDGALEIVFDADWSVVWQVDAEEVFALRSGNRGPVGQMRHRFLTSIQKGFHVLSARIRSGTAGWKLVVHSSRWLDEVPDELKTGRDAAWRDYARSLVRLEDRGEPNGSSGGIPVEACEHLLINAGVEARWISVNHNHEGAYYPSQYLPMWEGAHSGHEQQLKHWIRLLHERHIPVLSWLTLTENAAAWKAHPEWRQHYLVAPTPEASHAQRMCCINTGYGEALIQFALEAIERFDLDGLWFDGANLSTSHVRPLPVSCVCPACRERFQQEAGKHLPTRLNWEDPDFRRWVQWRYDNFSAYWEKLESTVHARYPTVRLAFNHYHREGIGWTGGIPLQSFANNIISATEADGELLKGAFYGRCMRAYGRKECEVWLGLNTARKQTKNGWVSQPKRAVEFASLCALVGVTPAFGGGLTDLPALQAISGELKPHDAFMNLPAIPQIGLYISQQTETYVFGRDPEYTGRWRDPYWKSAIGWHDALSFAGLSIEVFFDEQLSNLDFCKYPVIVMPFAIALSEEQKAALAQYVRDGGTVICGPWFASCNEEGEPYRSAHDLSDGGIEFPGWTALCARQAQAVEYPGGTRHIPVFCEQEQATISLCRYGRAHLITAEQNGKGRIFRLMYDFGGLFRYQPHEELLEVLRLLLESTPQPLLSVQSSSILLGLFQGEHACVIAKLMRYRMPWSTSSEADDAEHNIEIRWRGPQPKRILCRKQSPGLILPIQQSADYWCAIIPCIVKDEILSIEYD